MKFKRCCDGSWASGHKYCSKLPVYVEPATYNTMCIMCTSEALAYSCAYYELKTHCPILINACAGTFTQNI